MSRRHTHITIKFTHREQQIIALLMKDYSYKMVSEALLIKFKTVCNEIAHLREKIGCHSVHRLVAYAFTHGITLDFEANKVYYLGVIVNC